MAIATATTALQLLEPSNFSNGCHHFTYWENGNHWNGYYRQCTLFGNSNDCDRYESHDIHYYSNYYNGLLTSLRNGHSASIV
jgi:hypothetical protein